MLHKDVSLSALAAGFLAVLISYAGPAVIFFQAAQSAQVSHEMMASWIWAISMGAAVTSIALSWWLKVPAVIAWAAPGTALLVTLFPALSLGEAVGADGRLLDAARQGMLEGLAEALVDTARRLRA